MQAWLNGVDEWLLFLIFLALLIAAAELGFRLARRSHHGDETIPAHATATQGAILGLLALLLGFTFSLAVARFEARRALLRDEANAIGTTYLRAQLLPAPMNTRLRALLRTYVETRFELTRVGPAPEKLSELNQRCSMLQSRMWDEAIAVAKTDSRLPIVALFIASLNDTIDMHGKRMAAIQNQVPALIWLSLFLVAIVSLGLAGYVSGPYHLQAFLLNALMAVLIATVMLVIFDLHRPTRGLIQVDMSSLVLLRDGMR